MTTTHVLTEIRDGILRLQLDRADKKNALTGAMYDAMRDALLAADRDASVRVALIHGQPGLFTAGNDLADFLARRRDEEPPAIRFLRALASFSKPIVAAVGGDAVGIGTTLLLHCDLIVASPGARFRLPFVNLALCPEAASSYLLPRVAGYHRAAALLLLGEPFDAAAAREAGIVHRIVTADELLAAAAALAAQLAAQPAESVRITKALLKASTAEPVSRAMAAELVEFSRLVSEPAAKEIFAAFLEKRAPNPAIVRGERS